MEVWGWRVAMIAAATAAGFFAKSLGLPLPWMIGPLVLTGCLAVADIEIPRHKIYRPLGQLIVATAVGLYFSPEALRAVAEQAVEMIAAAVLTIGAGFTSALLLHRLARTDGSTAFFSAMPGGPAEMSVLAERAGVPGGPVVFSQTLRIVFIVIFIPPLLKYFAGISAPTIRPTAEVNLPGLLILYAAAAAGMAAMRAARLPNCNFLGPLAVGALISAPGFTLSGVPTPLLSAGQVLLGISLGAQFNRHLMLRDPRFTVAAVITAVALLLQCAAVGAIMWFITGGGQIGGYLLATAPGSVTEMALTAKLLHQGVAMVTSYHLVRIFIIIPLAPLLYRMFRRLMRGRITFHEKDVGKPPL